ncbi:MAG: UDP-galactopyranose mutase [Cellulomonadaceae bacterium]|nr:UDP-galactopyranose mutase [Cellulomonadaceae bacterium]
MSERVIVVGSGFSGSILARKIAEECQRDVLVVERRPHIGGNMFDSRDNNGVLVQRYGPHILNTNAYRVIEFLGQYSELFPFDCHLLSYIDGKYMQLPFNFTTVRQFVGPKRAAQLYRKFREQFRGRDRVPILELLDNEESDIRDYGNLLFEKAYRTYTSKMWGIPPELIDRSVLDRVPMAMGYDTRYLNKDFQYLPKDGFTSLFHSMLDHPRISIELETDATDRISFNDDQVLWDKKNTECLIYTGCIDELFGYRLGLLPYRSLRFTYRHFDNPNPLPCEIISYPQADGYIRTTDYRELMKEHASVTGTTTVTEWPVAHDPESPDAESRIPYYPVLTSDSKELYTQYRKIADNYRNLYLCGRLAEFRYYNMDVCIEHALSYFGTIKHELME